MEHLAGQVRGLARQRDDYEKLYRFTEQVSRAVRPDERCRRAVELATEFLGAECVLVRVDDPSRVQDGTGTIIMREKGEFVEHAFSFGPDGRRGVPTFLDAIIQRWLSGEFAGRERIESDWVLAYPLKRHDRRLGLLLIPASAAGEQASPTFVQALTVHVADALVVSDMQTQLVKRERLAAIGETVAGLAHCLKNLLNGLRAGQYIIDRAVDRDDMLKIRRGWSVMQKSIGQVEKLTFNMLYAVKELRPKREPVDANEVVREVVSLVHFDAASQGITVSLDMDGSIGVEPLDRMTIYRAILNLVTNAIDACVESDDGRLVQVTTRAHDDEIVIAVRDDGIGMSRETLDRLFTKFFSTKPGKGTGLGLPVVKRIVEDHGGTLEIDSREGMGSTFRIRLPRRGPAAKGEVPGAKPGQES
jgi:signal transduction histidine kinase